MSLTATRASCVSGAATYTAGPQVRGPSGTATPPCHVVRWLLLRLLRLLLLWLWLLLLLLLLLQLPWLP